MLDGRRLAFVFGVDRGRDDLVAQALGGGWWVDLSPLLLRGAAVCKVFDAAGTEQFEPGSPWCVSQDSARNGSWQGGAKVISCLRTISPFN